MLILGRKPQQRVRLVVPPSDVETAIWVTMDPGNIGNHLGIDAPRWVDIRREELVPEEER